jgi:HSP20 family protein
MTMALVRRERTEWPDMVRRLFDTDWDQGWLRVEEFRDGDDIVLRAELPGVDPDKDVELSIADGVLHIDARREEKSELKERGGYRSEFRYGRFTRSFVLPTAVNEEGVTATYSDGVLAVRVPIGPAPKESVTKVPVTKS